MIDIKDIITNFYNKKVVVVGDIMLDEFLFGDVKRINPEAPVPVLSVTNRLFKPGGAANVSNNLVDLGAKSYIIGRIGNDESANILIKEFKKLGINHNLIVDKSMPTIRKVRSIAKNQQLLRVDFEEKKYLEEKHVDKIIKNIKEIKPDIIIVSDYNKGFITKKLMDELKKLAIRIICDLKPENKELFKNVFLIKPNLKEAQELSGIKGEDDFHVEAIGKKLMEEFNSNVMITRSEKGMSLFEKNGKIYHIPTKAQEVYDVTGAGDTVIATLALSLSANATLEEATIISNHAAGIVVKKIGTATITSDELIQSLNHDFGKIKTRDEIKSIVEDLKLKMKKIVFTNGCYDILHLGHISLLKEAKKQGDILIVGLNTDESVKTIKGPTRPINNENDRADVIASIEGVDYVVLFNEKTPEKIIKMIKPDIHVKGGDYNPYDYKKMPEAKIVHSYGGKVHIVKTVDGKSTTNIINKINEK